MKILARLLGGGWAATAVLFLLVAAALFHGVFLPGATLFSNDGSLGELMADCHRMPGRLFGCWEDLNNIGFNGGAAAPSFSFGLQWLLGPVWFLKFYAMFSVLVFGLGAWCFFRELKLSPLACALGGLAAMLNSSFFSTACWGVGAHDIAAGMMFFALAALADPSSPQRWRRVILAGLALGMAVTEGADVGALFSLCAAAFAVYQIWTLDGTPAKKIAVGLCRLGLVAACAVCLAAQSLHGLVTTSIKGVTGAKQDAETKRQQWDWATAWSLPKLEVLNLIEPGIFGFRIDTLNGGTYWGRIGRGLAWEKYFANGSQGPRPAGLVRHTGGGNYTGEIVVLVALWAGAQSMRRKNQPFDLPQRKWLWFWLATAVISLLLAFGRYAPFFQLIYALPYFSTIRNPVKFLYFVQIALVVMFAFGVDGLARQYLRPAAAHWDGLPSWWRRAPKFDKFWFSGCAAVWLASLVAWWQYAQHRDNLIAFLQSVEVPAPPDQVADFSILQAGWFVVVFFLAAGLMLLIVSRAFAGRRAQWGGIWLAALLAGDLAVANGSWITCWNYPEKYSSNAVLDAFRDKPYERRIGVMAMNLPERYSLLPNVYQNHWLAHLLPYYNIQSFDIIAMPRVLEDFASFSEQIRLSPFHLVRAWQLTSTRYFLGPANSGASLVDMAHLAPGSVPLVSRFEIEPKPEYPDPNYADQFTAKLDRQGRYGVFDLTFTLPRAKLFSRWQVNTNDDDVLKAIFDPAFDPAGSVFVDSNLPGNAAANPINSNPGSVTITSYAPKDIVLHADAAAPAVLMTTDHFDPNWKVFVDGQPAALLRCNYLMRGVQVPPGAHQVEFKFVPPTGWLYISLAALAVAVLVLASLIISVRKNCVTAPEPKATLPPSAATPLPAKGKRRAENHKSANRSAKPTVR